MIREVQSDNEELRELILGFLSEFESNYGDVIEEWGDFKCYEYGDLHSYWGGGYEVDEGMEETISLYLKQAIDAFKEDHKEDLKKIKEDDIHYNGLYDLGKTDLAETLSEYEREFLSGDYGGTYSEILIECEDDDTIRIRVGISYSNAPYHNNYDYMPFDKTLRYVSNTHLRWLLNLNREEIQKAWDEIGVPY